MTKTALITGASSGIGRGIAHKFGQEGWEMVSTGSGGITMLGSGAVYTETFYFKRQIINRWNEKC